MFWVKRKICFINLVHRPGGRSAIPHLLQALDVSGYTLTFMTNAFRLFSVILILSSCRQDKKSSFKDHNVTFKVSLNPSFDEKAEVVLSKNDTGQNMIFLILYRQWEKKSADTFYFKEISISDKQYSNFDSSIIQKTKIAQPHQWTGCCDGMPVLYLLICNGDTSRLHFRSPEINKPDSSGYNITKATIDHLRVLYNDSVITDYLHDVESYMDGSKRHIRQEEHRAINRLRRVEYSR